jgi:hypothetical protein
MTATTSSGRTCSSLWMPAITPVGSRRCAASRPTSSCPKSGPKSPTGFFEKRRGWERRRKSDPTLAAAKLAELDALEAAYGSRVVPIDGPVMAELARLLGAKDKNQRDQCLSRDCAQAWLCAGHSNH